MFVKEIFNMVIHMWQNIDTLNVDQKFA